MGGKGERFRRGGHRLCREVVRMKSYYITFRSVTFAQRGEKLLVGKGYHCRMQRAPRWMESQGCGYALRIWGREIAPAVELLRQEGVPMRRVYAQTEGGQLEEVAL